MCAPILIPWFRPTATLCSAIIATSPTTAAISARWMRTSSTAKPSSVTGRLPEWARCAKEFYKILKLAGLGGPLAQGPLLTVDGQQVRLLRRRRRGIAPPGRRLSRQKCKADLENQHFLSFLCPISQVIQGSALYTFHQRLIVNPARLQTSAACRYGDPLANKRSQHLLHVIGSVGWRLPPQPTDDAIA